MQQRGRRSEASAHSCDRKLEQQGTVFIFASLTVRRAARARFTSFDRYYLKLAPYTRVCEIRVITAFCDLTRNFSRAQNVWYAISLE